MMQRQRRLDQARHARGRIEMPDIGLHGADPAGAHGIRGAPEGIGQCRHLDGIAQVGAGAVTFHVVDAVGPDARQRLRLGNRLGLPADGRRQVACLVGAIIVHRRALDYGPNVIPVRYRVRRTPQHDAARTGAEDRSLRAVVKRMAVTIGRQDLALLEEIAARVRQLDRHAARKRHVAFAHQKRLTGVMGGDKRGGTGRLKVDRRPAQIEDMAQAGGHEILVIAGMAQQEHPRLIHQIAVGTDVEIEIAAHAAARVNPYIPFKIIGDMARLLHRFPSHFQELAMLRVHDRGFFGREPEEVGVKPFEPVQNGGGRHVVRPVDEMRRFACGQQLFAAQPPDRLDPVAQISPIGMHVLRPRKMRGHADDGDIVLSDHRVGLCSGHVSFCPAFRACFLPCRLAGQSGHFRAKERIACGNYG